MLIEWTRFIMIQDDTYRICRGTKDLAWVLSQTSRLKLYNFFSLDNDNEAEPDEVVEENQDEPMAK